MQHMTRQTLRLMVKPTTSKPTTASLPISRPVYSHSLLLSTTFFFQQLRCRRPGPDGGRSRAWLHPWRYPKI